MNFVSSCNCIFSFYFIIISNTQSCVYSNILSVLWFAVFCFLFFFFTLANGSQCGQTQLTSSRRGHKPCGQVSNCPEVREVHYRAQGSEGTSIISGYLLFISSFQTGLFQHHQLTNPSHIL